jgi:hypothetical protein
MLLIATDPGVELTFKIWVGKIEKKKELRGKTNKIKKLEVKFNCCFRIFFFFFRKP